MVYRRLSFGVVKKASIGGMRLTATVVWILIGAQVFSDFHMLMGAGKLLRGFMTGLNLGPWGVIIFMQLTMMIMGCIMDEWIIVLICAPLYTPIAVSLGFDPIWFGILMILNMEIAIQTNSSSPPCSQMANSLSRPERFFNINFSQPQDSTDKLVELMRGAKTGDEAMIVGEKFVRLLDMVPIITYREIMGFSFNRIWRAVKREALHLVDQGYSDYQDIDRAWMMEFGTPFGPFGLMDIIGLDVVRDIEAQ